MAATVEIIIFLHNHIHKQAIGSARAMEQCVLVCLFPLSKRKKVFHKFSSRLSLRSCWPELSHTAIPRGRLYWEMGKVKRVVSG